MSWRKIIMGNLLWYGIKIKFSSRARCPTSLRLESRLVSSKHEKFFKDFLASCNLLFFSFFSLSFVVLSSSSFCHDKVSVTLSFEFSISVIK